MPDGQILTWHDMSCAACEATIFAPIVALRSKPGGGLTTEQKGWQCAQCGTRVDVQKMHQRAELKQKQAELAALEAELKAAAPPVTDGSPSSRHS